MSVCVCVFVCTVAYAVGIIGLGWGNNRGEVNKTLT